MKRILIIATRQIGDTLITFPLIEEVRKIWPDAKIDFLTYNSSFDLLKEHPCLHHVFVVKEKPTFVEYFQQFFSFFRKYDLSIITQPSDRAYIYGFLASKKIVGIISNEKRYNWWKKILSYHTVEIDYFKQHVVIEKLYTLLPFITEKKIFHSDSGICVRIYNKERIPDWLSIQLLDSFVVVHPTPLRAYKRWPVKYWIKLIDVISINYQVILSGSNQLQDKILIQEIVQNLSIQSRKNILNLSGKLKLNELVPLLKKAKLYIGIDTSITHLAAACDVPTIALFGPTPPTNFGPWPNGFHGKQPFKLNGTQCVGFVNIIQGPGHCVPCRKEGCDDHPNSKSECLNQLDVNDVIFFAKKYIKIY